MDTRVAGMTVTSEVPEMRPEVAVMVVAPSATPVTFPLLAPASFTVAAAGTDEVQLAVLVMFAVVRSEKWPVGSEGRRAAMGTLAGDGVTSMDTSAGGTTVTSEVPEISPDVAVMVVPPSATPVTFPLLAPTLFTVAAAGTDEVQFAVLVMFAVVPSKKWPV